MEEVVRGDRVELAVYTDAAGAERLRETFHDARSSPVAAGWQDAWRAFHQPVLAGGLWIGPPWLEPPSGARTVVIDPGRAFGTGAHPTTRLCLDALAALQRGSLCDIGCGSGVLAIAAARLGFGPVLAVDVDAVAVEVARANAAVNGVTLDVDTLDATEEPLPLCDVAVANVSAEVVERVLRRLQGPIAVTSGYLEDDEPVHDGWRRLDRSIAGGWAADIFERETTV